MRNPKVKEMTTIAMFTAIIALMSAIPQLGFIEIGLIAVTIIHIPVLIGGIYGGKRVTIALATIFGLASFVMSFIRTSGFNVFFQIPLISILPRFLFGLAIWGIFVGLGKLTENVKLRVAITLPLATFAHTVITLTAFYLFAPMHPDFGVLLADGMGPILPFIWSILWFNGFIEILLALVIGTPIALRLREFDAAQNV